MQDNQGTHSPALLCTYRYICTYRLSQDHLELLFSCIRQRGGWNNNHSAAQFRYAYRAILLHAEVRGSSASNVLPNLEGDVLLRHQGNLEKHEDEQLSETENIMAQPAVPGSSTEMISNFTSEVICYIGGYVVRKVLAKIACAECIDILVKQDATSVLIYLRNNGGLITPSRFVVSILECSECVFRLHASSPQKLTLQRLLIMSFREFASKHEGLLSGLVHYTTEPQHVLALIRAVMQHYLRLRLHELSKRVTEKAQKAYVRCQLTKQMLFLNQ